MRITRRTLVKTGAAGVVFAPKIAKAKLAPPVPKFSPTGTGAFSTYYPGTLVLNGNPQAQTPSGIALPSSAQFFTFAGITRQSPGALASQLIGTYQWNSTPSYPSLTNVAFYANSVLLTTGSGQVALALDSDANSTHSHSWYFNFPDDGGFHEWAISVRTDTREGYAIADGAQVTVYNRSGNFDPGGPFSVPLDPSWAWLSGADLYGQGNPGSPPQPPQINSIFYGDKTEFLFFAGNDPSYFTNFSPDVIPLFWNADNGIPAEPGSWLLSGIVPSIIQTGGPDLHTANYTQGYWSNGTDYNPNGADFDTAGAELQQSDTDAWQVATTVRPKRQGG